MTRVKVEFHSEYQKELVIPPYILGLLLGDGHLSTKKTELTTADQPIAEAYTQFCESLGYEVSLHTKKDSAAWGLYHKTGTNNGGKRLDLTNDPDVVRRELRRLGLLDTNSGSKFIPLSYQTRSISDRLELLAGLIDTDGFYDQNKNSYEYCSKSRKLAEDVIFVARTAGLKACEPTCKVVDGVAYYRVNLSGFIPSRLERKQTIRENTKQQQLTHGFSLESVGEGDIYGFTVDKDNLYLMEDTTIQRNCGKSHLAFEAAKSVQAMGGVAVYIDTENATSPENLRALGLDVKKNFVFIQTNCTEEVFKWAETAILKCRAMNAANGKDAPMVIIWDSVAACSPKAELQGNYDDNSIGLQARVLSKGMRKISNIIANEKVVLLLINQQRMKIGVMYGDPCLHPLTRLKVRRKISA